MTNKEKKITSKTKRWNDLDLIDVYNNGKKMGKAQTLKDVKEKIKNKDFLEHIADLEHDQWIEFTTYMLRNLDEKNKARWYIQCETPYPELSNKEQESDRKFAKIIIEELLSQLDDNSQQIKTDIQSGTGEQATRKTEQRADTRKGLCKCGHTKRSHISKKDVKDGIKALKLGECGIIDCRCKKYEEQSQKEKEK